MRGYVAPGFGRDGTRARGLKNILQKKKKRKF